MCFSGTMELPARHGHCFSFSSVTVVLLDCHGHKYYSFSLEQVWGFLWSRPSWYWITALQGGWPVNYP
jgi:hypothetical protein